MDIRYLNKVINDGVSKVNDSYEINILEMGKDNELSLKVLVAKEDGTLVKAIDNLDLPNSIDGFLTNLSHRFMNDYDLKGNPSDKYFYKDFIPKVKEKIDVKDLIRTSSWVDEKELEGEDLRREELLNNPNLQREVENYVFDGEIREIGKSFIEKISERQSKKQGSYWIDKLVNLEKSDYLTLSDVIKTCPDAKIYIAMPESDDDILLTNLINNHKFNKDEMFVKKIDLCKDMNAIDEGNLRSGTFYNLTTDNKGKNIIDSIYLDESTFEKLNVSQKLKHLDKDSEME